MPVIEVGRSRHQKAKINYQIHGNGPNKVLFIMGLAATLEGWEHQMESFMEKKASEDDNNPVWNSNFEICRFDNRGVGHSSVPLGAYTMKMMALDALELILSLGWESVHVIGLSMGGMIALRLAVILLDPKFAESFPKKIPKLQSLSLAVTHFGGRYSEPPSGGKKIVRKSLVTFNETKRAALMAKLLFSKRFLSDPEIYKQVTKELEEERNKPGGKQKFSGLIGQFLAIRSHRIKKEELELIKKSNVPILVITGDEDLLVDPRNSEDLKDSLSPVEYIVIKETGHVINVERKSEFNEAIMRNLLRGIKEDEEGGLKKEEKVIQVVEEILQTTD